MPEQVRGVRFGGYAEVVALSLAFLDLPADLKTQQVSVVTGKAEGLLVKDGQIRFITPEDPGVNTEVVLKVALANADVLVPVEIESKRPTNIGPVLAADEEGNWSSPANLRVTGLGAGNLLQANAMSFSADDAPSLDPTASKAIIFVPQTSQLMNIAPYWEFDPASNRFNISAQNMQQILDQLPAGDMDVTLGLTSDDGHWGKVWSFLAYKGVAALSGSVVDPGGAPVTSLAGRKVALRGSGANRTRRVLTIGANGQFSTENLPTGTYWLALLDTEAPNFWAISFGIYESSTQVSVTLPYQPLSAQASSAAKVSAVRFPARVTQNGAPPPRDASRASSSRLTPMGGTASGPGCTSTANATGTSGTYTVVSAEQDEASFCEVSYTLPQGTANVGIAFTISSLEYPTYTQAQSIFNDSWSYTLFGLAGVPETSGEVNNTHYTHEHLTHTYCVDTAALTKNGPYTFKSKITATDVEDSYRSARVVMKVTENCAPVLRITTAEFLEKNKRGYRVVSPVTASDTGNLAGNYISLPIQTDVQDWGIPLKVEYTPKEAKITRARIGIIDANGILHLSNVDISKDITARAVGTLSFADLKIPAGIVAYRFAGKINVVLELEGTYENSTLTSEATEIQHKGSPLFTPLFLAGDYFDAGRRFSFRDTGNDSWATNGTINYLYTNLYRFNDVSALHVAQTSTGNSILKHAGHSDGTQIDLRYADGAGGFSEELGGAGEGTHIRDMLNAAAAEVKAGGTTPKPKLAQAIAWITANRALLEKEAVNARRIYVGLEWIEQALHHGKFPDKKTLIPALNSDNTTQQPGPGLWKDEPSNVLYEDEHLHHWHISLP